MAKEYDTTNQLWFSRFPSSEEMVPDVARIRVLSALEMKTPDNQSRSSVEWAFPYFFFLFRELNKKRWHDDVKTIKVQAVSTNQATLRQLHPQIPLGTLRHVRSWRSK